MVYKIRLDGAWFALSTCRSHRHAQTSRRCMHLGLSYKSIIWILKREKSVGFFCGQRYSWTKVLRTGLLAKAYALIFRNQTNLYFNQTKRKDRQTPIYWTSRTASDGISAIANGFGFGIAACAPPTSCLYLSCHSRRSPLP